MNDQKVQLVLSFDPHPERREEYFQFFMCEFIPTLELLGLKMCEAWHTAYGEYPLRLSCFHARGSYAVEEIVESARFSTPGGSSPIVRRELQTEDHSAPAFFPDLKWLARERIVLYIDVEDFVRRDEDTPAG